MNVEIIDATNNPMELIAIVAGTCYGKEDAKIERVRRCMMNDHMGVFEHVKFTARISGISRACSHQIVRHRIASFCQVSQRYTKVNTRSNNWYVVPPEIDKNSAFKLNMSNRMAGIDYNMMLDAGVKPEDARYILPESTKTTLCMTMNARELFHFLELRTDKHAQWEIRNIAVELLKQLEAIEGWKELINEWKCKHCW